MRRSRMVVAGLSLLSVCLYLTAGVLAQEERSRERQSGDQPAAKVKKASKVIGYTVKNSKGEELGKIEELVIDEGDGRITYVVLSFGGFLGIGDKLFAIPWNAFEPSAEEEVFILEVDKEQLKRAPGFNKNEWPNMADRRWGSEVHRFYGARPYWEESQERSGADRSQSSGRFETGRFESGRVQPESVKLPLKWEKGKSFTYHFQPMAGGFQRSTGTESEQRSREERSDRERTGQSQSSSQPDLKDLKYRIEVQEVSGGTATLAVTFNSAMFESSSSTGGSGGQKPEKSVTVKVTQDGRLQEGQVEGAQRSRESQEGAQGREQSSQGSSGSMPTELRNHLQMIVGTGLHEDTLQVGKLYTPGQAQGGSSCRLRFNGKSKEGEHEVAHFTLLKSGSSEVTPSSGRSDQERQPQQREQQQRGQEERQQFGQSGQQSADQPPVGEVTYRLKDGLLEKLTAPCTLCFPGSTKFGTRDMITLQRKDW